MKCDIAEFECQNQNYIGRIKSLETSYEDLTEINIAQKKSIEAASHDLTSLRKQDVEKDKQIEVLNSQILQMNTKVEKTNQSENDKIHEMEVDCAHVQKTNQEQQQQIFLANSEDARSMGK